MMVACSWTSMTFDRITKKAPCDDATRHAEGKRLGGCREMLLETLLGLPGWCSLPDCKPRPSRLQSFQKQDPKVSRGGSKNISGQPSGGRHPPKIEPQRVQNGLRWSLTCAVCTVSCLLCTVSWLRTRWKWFPPVRLTPFGRVFGTVDRGFEEDFGVCGQHNFRIRFFMKF